MRLESAEREPGGLLGELDALVLIDPHTHINALDPASSTLADILGYLVHPPFEKLGVLHVDKFFPPADRQKTLTQLNALLASPAFAAARNSPFAVLTPASKTPRMSCGIWRQVTPSK